VILGLLTNETQVEKLDFVTDHKGFQDLDIGLSVQTLVFPRNDLLP